MWRYLGGLWRATTLLGMGRISWELAAAIDALRGQLLAAQKAGEGKSVSFGVGKVEVEFTVEAKTTDGGGVGVKFWVLNANTKIDHSSRATHKVMVELIPTGADGQRLKVAGGSVTGPPAY